MVEPEKQKKNGILIAIRWELLWMVVQFFVLSSMIVFNYASTQQRLTSLEKILDEHIKIHGTYLKVEVWELRNKFIDEKLNSIERKLDALLIQQKADTDRVIK